MILFDSEKSLEDLIENYFNEHGEFLVDDLNYDACYRQFDTKGYGICDLVFIGCEIDFINGEPVEYPVIHIVELKNDQIKLQDIAQISRYKTFFDRAAEFYGINKIDIKCSLIVPGGISKNSDCCYLINSSSEWLDTYEFTLDPLSGIKFNCKYGYHKNEECFYGIKDLISVKETDGDNNDDL